MKIRFRAAAATLSVAALLMVAAPAHADERPKPYAVSCSGLYFPTTKISSAYNQYHYHYNGAYSTSGIKGSRTFAGTATVALKVYQGTGYKSAGGAHMTTNYPSTTEGTWSCFN